MRGLSAFLVSKLVFSFLTANAQTGARALAAKDLKSIDQVARKQAISTSGGTGSTKERCIRKLEEGNGEYTYKFVKGSSDQYEIVEIPKSIGRSSYIRYYASNGYAEINAGSAACNHDSKKKDVKAKLMEIFKATDDSVAKLQAETDRSIAKLNSDGSSYISGLSTFRIVCADAFPEVSEYLEKNNKLPVSIRTTGKGAAEVDKKPTDQTK
tara:strand:+ start:31042 stop:31674 length:633 start_codon:yes stop_codon:yes gene_type:complete